MSPADEVPAPDIVGRLVDQMISDTETETSQINIRLREILSHPLWQASDIRVVLRGRWWMAHYLCAIISFARPVSP